jgi:hypothetical protein
MAVLRHDACACPFESHCRLKIRLSRAEAAFWPNLFIAQRSQTSRYCHAVALIGPSDRWIIGPIPRRPAEPRSRHKASSRARQPRAAT